MGVNNNTEKKQGAYRVALCQINPTVGAIADNTALIRRYVEEVASRQASLAVFPELALCGYPPEDLLFRPGFLKTCDTALRELAAAVPGITVVIGCPYHVDGRVYNAAAVLFSGTVRAYYCKNELPNYGVFDEKRYFAAGMTPLFLRSAAGRLMVTVCEDIWTDDGNPLADAARERPDVLVNLSSSPFHAGKIQSRVDVIKRAAEVSGTAVLYVNTVGGQDELVFDGGSAVFSSDGNAVAAAERFSEAVLYYDLPRKTGGTGEKDDIILPAPVPLDPGGVVSGQVPALSEEREIYQALRLGIRDYTRKNGFQKVVLGLSGGIDSALTACIAVDALGRENVITVTMPSSYTSQGTLTDAGRLARQLGIELYTIPVGPSFEGLCGSLREYIDPDTPSLAMENLQARLRGVILMALSNKHGWLVLTNGNKSENAVGYATLYGDMAGGFNPIKDVFKTMVYRLAVYINEESGEERIPRSIIERPPTAELRADQKDEDSLPPYDILDPVLRAYVEEDRSLAAISAGGYDRALVSEVIRLVDRAEYKRRQAPPGIKITPKSFGRDRRLPITNRFRDE